MGGAELRREARRPLRGTWRRGALRCAAPSLPSLQLSSRTLPLTARGAALLPELQPRGPSRDRGALGAVGAATHRDGLPTTGLALAAAAAAPGRRLGVAVLLLLPVLPIGIV